MGIKIDISPKYLKTLQALLRQYLPYTQVWAFGSRVKFTAKPASDLDLVAFIGAEQEMNLSLLKDALQESDIPFRIDLHNWCELPETFHKNIESSYVEIQSDAKPKLQSGWETYRLGDICSKIGSGATPRGGKEAYLEIGEYSLIRSQNVLDFSFSKNGLAFISTEQAHELRNVIIESGDVLLNITGDSVARVCQVPDEILPARVNQHVAIIRGNPSIINQKYLKYYLLEPSFKGYMLGLSSSGATRNALTKVMIENFEIKLPDLPTQIQIAQILSSLDDKIELNLQMNQTLEAIAQATFKEWFVDFKFPGFDGELVNGLPKAWRMGSVIEIIHIQNGYAFKSSDFTNEGNNGIIKIRNISNKVVDTSNMQFVPDKIALKIDKRFKIESGDLLIAMTGAEVGKVGIVPNTEKSLWLNQRVGSFKEKVQYSKWFCYLILSTNEYQNILLSSASGSAQPNISGSQIERTEIILPSLTLIEEFGSIVNSLFEKILENYSDNETLTATRDALLPMLMSGKIEIKN